MNFTKLFVGAFALSEMLVACDSDSASAKDTELEELSSSSVIASEATQSSSSETTKSSSSSENISAGSVYDATAKTLTDLRDGQTYKTVTIGDQTWMAENLNYASDSMSWCYDNDPANCAKYGRLYTWAAAMDSVGTWTTNGKGCGYNKTCSPTYPVRGVCPEGWHLPSTTEFETLFTAVGGQDSAGTVLKSTGGWYNDGNGTYAFGFSALPAGLRNGTGGYYYEGDYAYFWSSTEYYSNYAYSMYLYYGYDFAGLDYYNKDFGRSVRCVKD